MKIVVLTSLIVMMITGATFANPEGVCEDGKLISKLNIIGVKKDNNANMEDNNGHVLFVNLNGNSKIELVNSYDPDIFEDYSDHDVGKFKVLDKNVTGGNPSVLALPDPGLDPYVVPVMC